MANILLVDTDHSLNLLFTARLQRHGHEVLFALDGNEGLTLATRLQPDLVIIDDDIPGLSGQELLCQLRHTEWGKKVPVILVTNTSLPATSLADSADLTLYKPVSTVELIAIVTRLLHTTTGETVKI
jgi:DNA-binding response OmpR family regulator